MLCAMGLTEVGAGLAGVCCVVLCHVLCHVSCRGSVGLIGLCFVVLYHVMLCAMHLTEVLVWFGWVVCCCVMLCCVPCVLQR